ncbi:hypothetical protein ACB094_05G150600 [Castanea mollissima]
MNIESERGRLFKVFPDPMLERKCSWKFKIQFLVPKKIEIKIKIKEQTLNSNSLKVVPATNIIKNPKKKQNKTLLKKNGKLHERKPNLTLHHLQISNPEKLASHQS